MPGLGRSRAVRAPVRALARAVVFGASEGAAAPVNTVAPTIYGSARADITHVANPGTWTGAASYEYHWRIDGALVSGATFRNWRPGSDNREKSLSCDVRAVGPTGVRSDWITTAALALNGYAWVDDWSLLSGTPALIGLDTPMMVAAQTYRRVAGGSTTVTITGATGRGRTSSTTATVIIWPSLATPTGANTADYAQRARFTWVTTDRSAAGGPGVRIPTAAADSGAFTGYFMEWAGTEWALRRRIAGATITLAAGGTSHASNPPAGAFAEREAEVRAVNNADNSVVTVTGRVFDTSGNVLLVLTGTDSDGSRITAINCPGIVWRHPDCEFSRWSTRIVGNTGVAAASNIIQTLKVNGVRTGFNEKSVIRHGDRTFVSSVDDASVGGGMLPHLAVVERGILLSVPFTDVIQANRNDHREASLIVLPNGRLIMWGSPHNSTGLYRRAANPRNYSFNGTGIQTYNDGNTEATRVSYSRILVTKHGHFINLQRFRSATQPPQVLGNPASLHVWPWADVNGAANMPQTSVQLFGVPAARPYIRWNDEKSGANLGDIHMLVSGDLPGEGPSPLYYFRAVPLANGTLDFYDAAGNFIANPQTSGTPFDPRISTSLVLDTTSGPNGGQNWPMDVKTFDGTVYMTSMRYPDIADDGSSAVASNLQRLEHWTHIKRPGQAIVSRQFTADMPRRSILLRASAIDGNDPNSIWACEWNPAVGAAGRYVTRLYSYDWDTGVKTLRQEWANPDQHFFRVLSHDNHDGITAATFVGSDSHVNFETYGPDTTMYAVANA